MFLDQKIWMLQKYFRMHRMLCTLWCVSVDLVAFLDGGVGLDTEIPL
jgi:hypothetical protein